MHRLTQTFIAIRLVAKIAAWGIAAAISSVAMADGYPSKPITVVAVSPPGGGDDFTARLFAQQLRESTKQTVMVENIAGGGATIAYANVARSAPDGHRLLISNSVQTSFPALYNNLPFDPVEGFEHIGLIFKTPFAVTVSSRLNVKTLAEFIQLAKASPGKLNFGSHSGVTQLMFSRVSKQNDLQMNLIPYKGEAPNVNDVLGGHVQFTLVSTISTVQHINEGKLTALAVMLNKRLSLLQNLLYLALPTP